MEKVVIIGSGIAGLGAAWTLRESADVTVIESASHVGGHADTVDVSTRDGIVPVDMGFIVYNELTYPHMIRLFDELDVPSAESEMSFSFSSPGFEYSGTASGLFGRANWLKPESYRLLRAILRFRDVARSHLDDDRTIGELVTELGFPDVFRDRYLLPMAAAIWSSPHLDAAEIPAGTLLRFFDQHLLLDVAGRPTWRTVTGGSREYVRRLMAASGARFVTDTPVGSVRRSGGSVEISTEQGDFIGADQVVFACHADAALELLGDDASQSEEKLLGAFAFSNNHAVMHSDPRFMPRARRTWSAWNVVEGPHPGAPVTVTYWMNRLQPLQTDTDVFVTLNPPFQPEHIHRRAHYTHPVFDPRAVAAQTRLPEIQGVDNTWFCGAWTGYGFHEDGLESGMAVGRAMGGDVPWWGEVAPHSQSARIADGVAGVLA